MLPFAPKCNPFIALIALRDRGFERYERPRIPEGAQGETLLWQAIDESISFTHHILLVRQTKHGDLHATTQHVQMEVRSEMTWLR